MKRLYAIGAVLLGLYLSVQGAGQIVVPAFKEQKGDCVVDYVGAMAWRDHVNPYSPEGLKRYGLYDLGHPPTTPFWYLPFLGVSFPDCHAAIGVVHLFLLALMLLVLATELGAPAPLATVILVFGACIKMTWMFYHLAMIQVGIPTAFLLVMSWWFLRRRMELEGGLMLGLACTFKFLPGLLMLFLLIQRRFKAFAAGCAVYLAIAVFMTWRYGLASWGQYFAKQPEINNFWAANPKNGALAGVILRLWWHACQGHGGNLPKATALTLAVSAVLLFLTWRVTRGVRQNAALFDGSFALWTVLAVFINPVAWEHYYVLLIFPWAMALALLVAAARDGLAVWKSAAATAALAGIVGMVSLDINLKAWQNRQLDGWHFRTHLFEIAGWLMWPLLMAVLGCLIYRQDRRWRALQPR